MLKPSECLPGVEVIAVKNYPYMLPALDIGAVYTLEELLKTPIGLICDFHQIVKGPFVTVAESKTRICKKCNEEAEAIYFLDQFKIRDVKKFEDLFNIHSVKIPELA